MVAKAGISSVSISSEQRADVGLILAMSVSAPLRTLHAQCPINLYLIKSVDKTK